MTFRATNLPWLSSLHDFLMITCDRLIRYVLWLYCVSTDATVYLTSSVLLFLESKHQMLKCGAICNRRISPAFENRLNSFYSLPYLRRPKVVAIIVAQKEYGNTALTNWRLHGEEVCNRILFFPSASIWLRNAINKSKFSMEMLTKSCFWEILWQRSRASWNLSSFCRIYWAMGTLQFHTEAMGVLLSKSRVMFFCSNT